VLGTELAATIFKGHSAKTEKKFQERKNTLNSIIFYKASLVTRNHRANCITVHFVSFDVMKVCWGVKACLYASLT